MKLKRIASLFLSVCMGLSLVGCQSAKAENKNKATANTESEKTENTSANKELEAYLNDFVKTLCEQDYSTLHHYFEHPEKYGIDVSKSKITLGTIVPTQEDLDTEARLYEDLLKLDTKDYSKKDLSVYNQLKWQFELSKEAEDPKFEYLNNIWSSFSGTQHALMSFFTEYQLREEADIEPLIELINDCPRYVEDALDYSKTQAEKGLFMIDYDGVQEDIDEVLKAQDNSSVTRELEAEVDSLNLDKEKANEYKEEINKAIGQSFFPAYEQMKSGLEALKDDVKPLVGLASLPNGKEYYALLCKDATGTSDSPSKIEENMDKALNSLTLDLANILDDGNLYEQTMDISTKFKNIDEILPFLEKNYTSQFPKVETMDYELQPLSNDQSQDGVVAYFVTPAVDETGQYHIRYNRRDYGDDPSSISLYQTLAHEGIPGHMYQAQYDKEHFIYPAEYFLSNSGFTEGYATYVENQSLDFLNMNSKLMNAYKTIDNYNNFSVVYMDIAINYEGMSQKAFAQNFGDGMEDLYNQLAENPTAFLSYYYGFYKINNLRGACMKKMGDDFDPVGFNNALLQYGAVNFDIIKESIKDYANGAM